MTYRDLLQNVDTQKALSMLRLSSEPNGAYIKFDCVEIGCEGKASIKAYGDKKNLWYCQKCHAAGHIISLAVKVKGLTWKEANEFLEKAISENVNKITEELNINYELFYNDFLKEKGISEDTCKLLEIGVPKGKTMLAGSVAFAVRDDTGMKVAYYGIKMKDQKPIFHKSFNPELYLYNFCNLHEQSITYFTTDLLHCVRMIQANQQAICNFGLPYLSQPQFNLIKNVDHIIFCVDEPIARTLAVQLAFSHKLFFRFEKQ